MYIELHDSLLDSQKVGKLSRKLKLSKREILGMLATLWLRVLRAEPDGILDEWDPQDVASAVDWTGDADELVSALERYRFLDRLPDGDGFAIHNWSQYTKNLIARKKATERKRKSRLENPVRPVTSRAGHSDNGVTSRGPCCDISAERNGTELSGAERSSVGMECSAKIETQSGNKEKANQPADAGFSQPPLKPDILDQTKADAELVLMHWKQLKPDARPRDRARRMIRARIEKDKWSVPELCQALGNLAASDWHRDNGYCTLDQVMRNHEAVEKWLAKAPAQTTSEKNNQVFQSILTEEENKHGVDEGSSEGIETIFGSP